MPAGWISDQQSCGIHLQIHLQWTSVDCNSTGCRRQRAGKDWVLSGQL